MFIFVNILDTTKKFASKLQTCQEIINVPLFPSRWAEKDNSTSLEPPQPTNRHRLSLHDIMSDCDQLASLRRGKKLELDFRVLTSKATLWITINSSCVENSTSTNSCARYLDFVFTNFYFRTQESVFLRVNCEDNNKILVVWTVLLNVFNIHNTFNKTSNFNNSQFT